MPPPDRRREPLPLCPKQLFTPWEWAGVEVIREGLGLSPEAALVLFDSPWPRLNGFRPRDVIVSEGPESALRYVADAVEAELRDAPAAADPESMAAFLHGVVARVAPWTTVPVSHHNASGRALIHRIVAAVSDEITTCTDAELSALMRVRATADLLVLVAGYLLRAHPQSTGVAIGLE